MQTYLDPNTGYATWAAKVADSGDEYVPTPVTFLMPGQRFLMSGRELIVDENGPIDLGAVHIPLQAAVGVCYEGVQVRATLLGEDIEEEHRHIIVSFDTAAAQVLATALAPRSNT